jgi:hypothetical protein
MVDTNSIESKLSELEIFFQSVKNSDLGESDKNSASYGLKNTDFLKITLEKYKKKPQNKLLKQIFNGFSSVTRGVEYFTDFETNEKFRKACKGIYQIQENLRDNINW